VDQHQVAVSANGKNIFINLMQPPASHTVARNPNLLSHIKEIAEKSTFEGETVELEYDMRRPVGYMDAIATKTEDTVFYARQLKTDVYTRFVKNRRSDATSLVSVRLRRISPDSYLIENVWIGPLPVPLPEGQSPSKRSQQYWTDHAIVYNGQPLVAGSVTKTCPY
jgi:hypothetical protein